jgi:5'-phosphate synthase pdxT subunit
LVARRRRAAPVPACGVLALQGGFAAHAAALADCGVAAREVRTPAGLEGLDLLVLPGGESTTLLKLLASSGLDTALPGFHRRGGALFATCAGAILLAREVTGPAQPSLDLLDASVARNHYGRQVDSFEDEAPLGDGPPLPLVFIRAPAITRIGPGVEVLARHGGLPVLVRDGRILAATFHPELTPDRRVHRLALALAGSGRTARPPAPARRRRPR